VSGTAVISAPFQGTAKQLAAAGHWRDSEARVITLGGAIRSGKTQAGGRLIVETAVDQPATYLIARSTYRELEDSTKKAMLHGDGALPPLIPPELIEQYRASDNLVKLRTGATLLFRSLEEGQVGKLLNLTLGGIFVDQIEELDDGDTGERIFDTLLGRLSDPRGPRKLIGVANPSGLTHWVYRRLVDEGTRDPEARYVHFTLLDNAANLPADYVAAMLATKETRPAWYRSFILGEWGAFSGAAFSEFEEPIHVVRPFAIPQHWERFESLDHGANHPTVVLAWAADTDGNLVVFGEYSSPGLVSKHAAELLARRQRWGTSVCHADPSVFASHGLTSSWGAPASVATEYAEHGIKLRPANNSRAAGYLRLLELLHVEPGRVAPPWASIRQGAGGAPRLYIVDGCRELVRQLKSAPVAVDGVDTGEAVDRRWEGEHGHAVASLRYGAMSRPAPAKEPAPFAARPSLNPLYANDQELAAQGRREFYAKWKKEAGRPRRGRYLDV
jgi:PBSX family phage terminase large subunit